MRHLRLLASIGLSLQLAACASGNVRSPSSYAAVRSPTIVHPDYDPYAAYGEANATWRPPVFDRQGTIVKPSEPSTQASRPDYEHAPWATGAAGGTQQAPLGTF